MPKVKILKVQFDAQISAQQIPAFRGAIIAAVGQDNNWFSNHLSEQEVAYRYPKIQYKRMGQHPLLFCLKEGVEEIHKFFDVSPPTICLNGQMLNIPIKNLFLNEFEVKVSDRPKLYRLRQWLALNQENYLKYQQLKYLTDQLLFLEKKLASNIISFAKSIQWHIDAHFEVKITQLHRQTKVTYKKQPFLAFDLDFETNLRLPNDLGLGRKVSVGFGVLRQVRSS